MRVNRSCDRRRARIVAIGLVAALVIAGSATAAPGATRDADAADAALDRALDSLVERRAGPPGVIVLVQRGDALRSHTAGAADTGTKAPPHPDEFMRLASVAKAFSGAAALALVADGTLLLDDTLGERLPTLPRAWADVTLAQLLGHTGGVPDFSQNKTFQDAVRSAAASAPPPPQLLSYVEDEPLEFRPGTRFQYSNSDNIIVALMIESATGRRYEDVLQERVYTPLGLTGTSLPASTGVPAPFIHGYAPDPPEPPEDVSEVIAAGWAWASGGILSTPSDANRFVRDYVQGSTTNISARAAQRRFVEGGSSEPPGPGKNAAGLALFRYRTRCGTVYGHTGNTPGYTQFVAATGDGTRSATVSVNAQITPSSNRTEFRVLRAVYELAVCAALA